MAEQSCEVEQLGKKVTSSDVAKHAGVSQATVSMVLNKKYNVSFSREVIERVEHSAEELGYELPKRKRKRESRREKLLVVFCPNLTNPYYVMLLQGIEARATEQGYGLFVCNTQRSLVLEEQYLKMLSSLNPRGVIYTCNPSRCYLEMIEELSKMQYEEMTRENTIAKLLGYETFDNYDEVGVYTRGYRILNKIPRMPSNIVENLISSFKSFQHVLAADIESLDEVDGIGEVRARTIRQALRRMQEQFMFE